MWLSQKHQSPTDSKPSMGLRRQDLGAGRPMLIPHRYIHPCRRHLGSLTAQPVAPLRFSDYGIQRRLPKCRNRGVATLRHFDEGAAVRRHCNQESKGLHATSGNYTDSTIVPSEYGEDCWLNPWNPLRLCRQRVRS